MVRLLQDPAKIMHSSSLGGYGPEFIFLSARIFHCVPHEFSHFKMNAQEVHEKFIRRFRRTLADSVNDGRIICAEITLTTTRMSAGKNGNPPLERLVFWS